MSYCDTDLYMGVRMCQEFSALRLKHVLFPACQSHACCIQIKVFRGTNRSSVLDSHLFKKSRAWPAFSSALFIAGALPVLEGNLETSLSLLSVSSLKGGVVSQWGGQENDEIL